MSTFDPPQSSFTQFVNLITIANLVVSPHVMERQDNYVSHDV